MGFEFNSPLLHPRSRNSEAVAPVSALVLDAGAFIAVDRDDRSMIARLHVAQLHGHELRTSAIVIAQAWRSPGGEQAGVARHCCVLFQGHKIVFFWYGAFVNQRVIVVWRVRISVRELFWPSSNVHLRRDVGPVFRP
jgi:hypothetical protein